MLPALATTRLALTPVEEPDLGLMRTLNADERVMRHLTGRAASAEATDAEWAQRLRERSDHQRGLGYWVGRSGGEFVGWWGLGACDWDATTANLGYRLLPGWWDQGLATEGGLALLRHGLDGVGLDSVWASTAADNEASKGVLARLGMSYIGVRHEQCQYAITAADWRNRALERTAPRSGS